MNTLPETALEKYNTLTVDSVDPDPIERLRFFLSLSLKGQDWLDVEQFIDDLQIPDGYKLVPIEPTIEMLEAAFADEITLSEAHTNFGVQYHIYKAMLDVSPPINITHKNISTSKIYS